MAEEKQSLNFKSSKGSKGLPKGAEVLSKEINVDVEEIENGYLITKRIEYKYSMGKDRGNDWLTVYKKYYTEENPIGVADGNKELADLFDA